MKSIKLGKKVVGAGKGLYFVADIGANHDGNLQRAFDLIEIAAESGADAAKFQNFTAAKIVSKLGFENLGQQLSHQKNWKKSVYEVYEDASIEHSWTQQLKQKCEEVGIDYFTSPYDIHSVDQVDPYVDLYKIGSGDISWLEIIDYISKKGKPVLLATGASSMGDVVRAMNTLEANTSDIVLMQCNTNYTLDPEKYKHVNLNVLSTFKARFPNVVLGLSDHTITHSTVLGAIALGAEVIEKHFTDNNDRSGPDHKFAVNPAGWREMVDRGNEVYYALGNGIKTVEPNELDASIVQRRCLRASKDLPTGHILQKSDFDVLRPIPETGLEPYLINDLIGKELILNMLKGEHFTLKSFK